MPCSPSMCQTHVSALSLSGHDPAMTRNSFATGEHQRLNRQVGTAPFSNLCPRVVPSIESSGNWIVQEEPERIQLI